MIYVNNVEFGKEELIYLKRCIKTGWISSEGPFVREFEESFSSFCGVKYGIACMNGTSAIHLGLLSLGVKKGDEVIIPTFTMIATAYAIVYSGARPVLVDAEPKTWNMDTSLVIRKINKKTKAILPVHIYGHPVDMEKIWQVKKENRLYILEDAAEAHGAEYKGIKTGALGDAAAFSFYANKIITTGEGGMVVTNNKRIAERARYFRNMAFQKKTRYLHRDIGYNYRMTNLQAAVGLAQMHRIDSIIKKKIKMATLYNEQLKDIEGLTIPVEEKWAKNVYWMYGILINEKIFGLSRNRFKEVLYNEGVDTRLFFIPMHKQPVFRKMGLFLNENHPVSEDISIRGLYLPSGLDMDEQKVDFVCDKIRRIKRKYG
jgi:perosamine synthetase